METIRHFLKQYSRGVLFSSVMIPFLLGLFMFKLKPPKNSNEFVIQPSEQLAMAMQEEVIVDFVFNGAAGINWTDQGSWSPSYPGTEVPSGNTVSIDAPILVNVNVDVSADVNVNAGVGVLNGIIYTQKAGTLSINTGLWTGDIFSDAGSTVHVLEGAEWRIGTDHALDGDLRADGLVVAFNNNTDLTVNGNVSGTGRLFGPSSTAQIILNGAIDPGDSPGCLDLSIGANNNATTTNIEVNGTEACTEHDQITSNNTVDYHATGTLNVSVGYTPVAPDEITIVSATNASIVGEYETVNLPADWSIAYNSPNEGQITLSYEGSLSGDFVFNGAAGSNWTDEGSWTPFYPGTEIDEESTVTIESIVLVNTPVEVSGDVQANAELRVLNGQRYTQRAGTLTLDAPLHQGDIFSDEGSLIVVNGQWRIGGQNPVIDGDIEVNGIVLPFSSNRTMVINGDVSGTGTVLGLSSITINGEINPGVNGGLGCLNITVDNVNNSSATNLQVNGTTPCTEHDQIQTNNAGDYYPSGTLNVSVDYTPTSGDQIVLVQTNASIVGEYEAVNIPEGWTIAYNSPNEGIITMTFSDPQEEPTGKCAVDTIPPEIYCPPIVTVNCGEDMDAMINPDMGMAMAADNCDPDPLVTFADGEGLDFCTGGTILRTWTAVDSSGNSTSCQQKILINPDRTPPSIEFIPQVLQEYPDGIIEVSCDTRPDFSGMSNWVIARDSCTLIPTVSFREEALPGEGCIEGMPDSIKCIWIAEDECGNRSAELMLIMVMVDTVAPEIVCPPDVTLACGESIDPAQNDDLGVAEATDNCDPTVDITYEDSGEVDFCEGGTIERTWFATDGCGNVDSCVQIITVLPDTISPTINLKPEFANQFPNGIVIRDCLDSLPSISEMAGWVEAFDDCDSEPSIELIETTEAGNCLEDGYFQLITCKWVATDRCGNPSDTIILEVQIRDTVPPTIECPIDLAVDCTVDINPITNPNIGVAVATDACDNNPVITYTDSGTIDFCNGSVITRTWKATDQCGNVDSCIQTITILPDTIAPVIELCPVDLAFSCNPETVPGPDPGSVLAFDNCTSSEEIAVRVDTIQNDTIGCEGIVVYEYTVSDICGNSTSCQQTITYRVDEEPPVFVNCPDPVDLGCNPEVDIDSFLVQPEVTDNCGLLSLEFEDIETRDGCTITIERVWTATDSCFNRTSCSQIVSYTVDTLAPQFLSSPKDMVLGCNPDSIPVAMTPRVIDNCEDPTVTFTEDTTLVGCTTTITRMWVAEDACGNLSDTVTQNITFTIDTLAPVIVNSPVDSFLGCNPTEIPGPPEILVEDDCGVMEIFMTSNFDVDGCSRTITRSWIAIDSCGNESEPFTQVITYTYDKTPPMIVCPADIDLGCNPEVLPLPMLDSIEVSDNCGDEDVTVVVDTIRNDTIGCLGILQYRFTATDFCGNSAEAIHTITYNVDNEAPVLEGCPEDLYLGCNPGEIPEPPVLTAYDNCEIAEIIFTESPIDSNGCLRSITRTWVAIDSCGNASDTCVQMIYYTENDIAPVITCMDDVMLDECNPAEIPPPMVDSVRVATACNGDVVEYNGKYYMLSSASGNWPLISAEARAVGGNLVSINDQAEQDFLLATFGSTERLWIGLNDIDTEGNFVWTNGDPLTYTNWGDPAEPNNQSPGEDYVIMNWYANGGWNDFDIESTGSPEQEAYRGIIEMDFPAYTVTAEIVSHDTIGCDATLVYEYTVTDICGNSDTCRQTIMYKVDEEPPVFAECPGPIDLGCNPDIGENRDSFFIEPQVTDNCGLMSLTFEDVETTDGCRITIERTWTAVDSCNNFNTCVQVVSYTVDTIPPVIACLEDIDLGCNPDSIPPMVKPEVTNDCSDVTINGSQKTTSDGCTRIIERTWIAIDACGNADTCVQIITYTVDTIAPVFADCPEPIDLGCNPEVAQSDFNGSRYVLTGTTGTWEEMQAVAEGLGGNLVAVNSQEEQDYLTARFGTNGSLWLGGTDKDAEGTFVWSNGDAFVYDNWNPSEPNNEPPQENYIVFNAGTPGGWNDFGPGRPGYPANGFQGIVEIPVSFDDIFTQPVVTDDCGLMSLTSEDTTRTEGCEVFVERTWTAMDSCGNVSTCTQVITYTVDTVAPQIDTLVTELVVQCNYDDPNWNPMNINLDSVIIVTDSCSNVNISVVDSLLQTGSCIPGDEGGRGFLELWQCTVTATDECGNSSEFIFFVTVIDTVPPEIILPEPDTIMASCDSIPMPPTITATDGCGVNISYGEEIRDRECLGEYDIIRTWVATDDCGNRSEVTQVVMVKDTVAPTIKVKGRFENLSSGDTLTVDCSDVDLYINSNWVSAMDNCDPSPTISQGTFTENLQGCVDGVSRIITVGWIAQDDCGNTTQFEVNLRVVDNTPPTILGVPADTCATTLPPVPLVKAVDDCSNSGVSVGMSQTGPIVCDGGSYYIRTWTATDACGNVSTVSQQISINDGTAPTIKILNRGFEGARSGDTITINADCDREFGLPELKVFPLDGCSDKVTTNVVVTPAAGDTSVVFSIVNVSISAVDLCGNEATLDLVVRTVPIFVRARGIFRIPVTNCIVDQTLTARFKPTVTAQLKPSQQVSLSLEVDNDRESYGYIIERSINGIDFEPIDGMESNGQRYYDLLDEAPMTGDNYYRVVHLYKDDSFVYSDMVKVEVPVRTNAIQLFPNPSNERVTIDFGELSGQGGVLQVVNPFGQLMRETNFELFPQDALILDLQNYANGVYKVIITTNDGERSVHSLVVQKF